VQFLVGSFFFVPFAISSHISLLRHRFVLPWGSMQIASSPPNIFKPGIFWKIQDWDTKPYLIFNPAWEKQENAVFGEKEGVKGDLCSLRDFWRNTLRISSEQNSCSIIA
jgi:hypothetical protein